MNTTYDHISKKISRTLNNSLLKDCLYQKCSDLQEVILSTQMKLWLEDKRHDANENKNYFNLSSGKLFEYYVVNLIDTTNWKFVSWRSDKIQNLFKNNNRLKPETNQYPDIVVEYCNDAGHNDFKKGDRIAIECKWTNHKDELSVEECAIKRMKYNNFYPKNALKDNACCLYYAIGVGWKITSKKQLRPEAVFFIPNGTKKKSCDEIRNFLVKRKPHLKKKESLINLIVEDKEIKEIISDSANKLDNLKKSLGIK